MVVLPSSIAYRSLPPRSGGSDNLLVPVCVSSTHIAYGSIRMEPVFMILGQSAATAASLAIDRNLPVQQVPYASLRERLVADKQVLAWDPKGPSPAAAANAATATPTARAGPFGASPARARSAAAIARWAVTSSAATTPPTIQKIAEG